MATETRGGGQEEGKTTGKAEAAGLNTPTMPDDESLVTEGSKLVAAFHTAAKAGDTATLSKLLDSSASSQLFTLLLNARERKSGRTALHTACRAGVPTSLAWLLDKGASVLVTDTEGYTPLDHARAKPRNAGCLECVRILQEHIREQPPPIKEVRADPFAKDKEGVSPLDMVMMSGHKASIQALSRAMRTQLASFLGLALLFLLYRRGGSPQQAWLVLATLWPLGKTWHLLLLLGKEKGAARERALGEWLTYWALLVPVVLLEHAVSAHLLPSPIFQQLLAPRSQGRQENGAVLRTLTDLYMITKIVATIYLIYPASRGARRVSRWLEGRREGGREEKMKKTRDGNDEKIKKKDD
ncbi:ankyrin [Nannochloropsis oceanica]